MLYYTPRMTRMLFTAIKVTFYGDDANNRDVRSLLRLQQRHATPGRRLGTLDLPFTLSADLC